jgi:hypothetical protein
VTEPQQPTATPTGRAPRHRTPPRKPSHWSRNITLGVIGLFVILAAVGSAASREGSVSGPTAPPEAMASQDTSAIDTTESAPPTPAGTSLLKIDGTGPATSDPFQASGAVVDVAYTYTCSAEDSFTLNFYGAGVSPILPDVLASEFGTTGSNTVTEPLNGQVGPFTVEIDSPCDWTVEVTGAP